MCKLPRHVDSSKADYGIDMSASMANQYQKTGEIDPLETVTDVAFGKIGGKKLEDVASKKLAPTRKIKMKELDRMERVNAQNPRQSRIDTIGKKQGELNNLDAAEFGAGIAGDRTSSGLGSKAVSAGSDLYNELMPQMGPINQGSAGNPVGRPELGKGVDTRRCHW